MKKDGKMQVDLLKVPHHGSSNNVDDDFFERIIAKHYVFSGNGDYGNPERETLEMLFHARGDDDYTIHLTYPIDEIDMGRKDASGERTEQGEGQEKEKSQAGRAARLVTGEERPPCFLRAAQSGRGQGADCRRGEAAPDSLLDPLKF